MTTSKRISLTDLDTSLRNLVEGRTGGSVSWADVLNKPSTFAPSTHTHTVANITGLDTTLNGKVDKVSGKGLSTNDFTDSLKTKLEGMSSGGGGGGTASPEMEAHIVNNAIHVTNAEKTAIGTIANKANTSDVNSSISAINTALNTKANATDVTTSLAAKANTTDVNNSLSGKLDVSTFNTHASNNNLHVNTTEKALWNSHFNVTTVDVSGTTLTLTSDRYQAASITTATLTLNLPTISTTFAEIHLYFQCNSSLTVTFPTVRWQKTPTFTSGKVYELIFTRVNGLWLGGFVEYA